jgi:uncharacterized protein (DUF2236 family)/uncharacterized protein YbjT (DUF2867 family)
MTNGQDVVRGYPTREAFVAHLAKLESEIPGGQAGFLPDAGAYRDLQDGTIIGTGFAAALLLQFAHAQVGAGLYAQSRFRTDFLSRALGTIRGLRALGSDTASAKKMALAMYNIHSHIHGELARPIPGVTSQRYSALDPEAQLWVWGTVAATVLRGHRLFGRKISAAEREEYYRHYRTYGELCAIPPERIPATYADFRRYWRAACDSPVVVVTPEAKQCADALFAGMPPGTRGAARAMAAYFLPAKFRRAFGLPWDRPTQRKAVAVMRAARLVRSVATDPGSSILGVMTGRPKRTARAAPPPPVASVVPIERIRVGPPRIHKAVVVGATGMIGGAVLEECLGNPTVEKVVAVGRRTAGRLHDKLDEKLHDDFTDFEPLADTLRDADVVFFCVGAYQAKVSAAKLQEVNQTYVERFVAAAKKANPAIRFCLLSTHGACPAQDSVLSIANIKGAAENAARAAGFAHTFVFRPGYVNPGAHADPTPAYALARGAHKVFPSIGIDRADLARVMVHVAAYGAPESVLENAKMRRIARDLADDDASAFIVEPTDYLKD